MWLSSTHRIAVGVVELAYWLRAICLGSQVVSLVSSLSCRGGQDQGTVRYLCMDSGPVTCHLSLVIQGIRVDGTRAAYGGRSRNFARLAGANNTSKSQQPCRLSDNYHFTSIHTIDSPLQQHAQVVTELHRICLPETERAQILIKTQTRSAVYGRRSRTRRRMSM